MGRRRLFSPLVASSERESGDHFAGSRKMVGPWLGPDKTPLLRSTPGPSMLRSAMAGRE
jgi:hypothetical protein